MPSVIFFSEKISKIESVNDEISISRLHSFMKIFQFHQILHTGRVRTFITRPGINPAPGGGFIMVPQAIDFERPREPPRFENHPEAGWGIKAMLARVPIQRSLPVTVYYFSPPFLSLKY